MLPRVLDTLTYQKWVKIYAELTGNCKRYGIKSPYGNKLAIEYGSDVLIGLQLEGAGSDNFDVEQAKTQNPRKVELKILKNRNGKTGTTVKFNYYTTFNLYREV